jgi:hypothetical protein
MGMPGGNRPPGNMPPNQNNLGNLFGEDPLKGGPGGPRK